MKFHSILCCRGERVHLRQISGGGIAGVRVRRGTWPERQERSEASGRAVTSCLGGGEMAGGGNMPGGDAQQPQSTVVCSCDGCALVETVGWAATHGRLLRR
jgi:hypothetical protein